MKGLRYFCSRAGSYQSYREKPSNIYVWFVLSQHPHSCILLILFSHLTCAILVFPFHFPSKALLFLLSFFPISHLHFFLKKRLHFLFITKTFVIQNTDDPQTLQVHVPLLQFQFHGKGIQLSDLTIHDLTS